MRRWWGVVAVAVVGVALVAVAAGVWAQRDRLRHPSATVSEAGHYDDAWQQVTESPLSARVNADAVWTGDEVLVFGGDEDAPCVDLCIVEPYRTAAAYDPASDEWRPLTDVPERFFTFHGAVYAGGHVLTSSMFGTDAGGILSYDVEGDRWGRVGPPNGQHLPRQYELVAGDDTVVFVSTCFCPNQPSPHVAFDALREEWRELPDDPFPNAARRQVAFVEGDLYVFTSQGGSGEVEGVVLRQGAARWTALPSLPGATLARYPERGPVVVEHFIALDGQLAVFDTEAAAWSALPAELQTSVPDLESRPPFPWTAAVTWLGDRWFAFGGRLEEGLTNQTYTWAPSG